MCVHPNFSAKVDVVRLSDDADPSIVKGFLTNVSIYCADCGIPFEFIGVGCGLSPFEPNVSVDGVTLRAPITPSTGKLRIEPHSSNVKLN